MRIRDVRAFNVFDGHWRNHLIVEVDGEDGLYGVGESGLRWQEAAVAATVARRRPEAPLRRLGGIGGRASLERARLRTPATALSGGPAHPLWRCGVDLRLRPHPAVGV